MLEAPSFDEDSNKDGLIVVSPESLASAGPDGFGDSGRVSVVLTRFTTVGRKLEKMIGEYSLHLAANMTYLSTADLVGLGFPLDCSWAVSVPFVAAGCSARGPEGADEGGCILLRLPSPFGAILELGPVGSLGAERALSVAAALAEVEGLGEAVPY